MDQWININEQEPEIGNKHLVAGGLPSLRRRFVARYAGEGVFYTLGCQKVPFPTHWAELPKLPEE